MCGIAGFSGSPDNDLLKKMCHLLVHRGPDEEGYHCDKDISLGIRRLSIVDIDGGKQPVTNETEDIWGIINGEIYNHIDLRKNLIKRGHSFRSNHADSEIMIHLYEEYGDKWPNYTNGMFGAAIWDKKAEKLLLFRDRIGKKPLYYSINNGQIIFASEIKSILINPKVSKDYDFNALYHYFGMKNISAPRTAYKQVEQLLPGHVLSWHHGGMEVRPYWKIDFSQIQNDIDEEEAAGHLFRLFENAVKLRMQCDVPFGAYLSGGIDSSSVVAVMSENHSKPIKTFCLGYEDKPEGQFVGKFEDLRAARAVADRLGTDHHEYIIDARQFAEGLPAIIVAFDEPFSGTISTYFLSILIKKHVTVALSGDGADELFGSYLAHRLAFPIETYLALKAKGADSINDYGVEAKNRLHPFDDPPQFSLLQKIASHRISQWRDRLCVFDTVEKNHLLTDQFLENVIDLEAENLYAAIEAGLTATDALNRSLEVDQKELLPNQILPFVDRLSMAHSIEVRVPYLDYRIIEFTNRLPGKLKIKDGIVKYIHKKTMQRLLPEDIVWRPKEGFVQPIYSWMHGSLKNWIIENLRALPMNWIRSDYLNELIEKFRSGDRSLNAKIWNLVCFNLWYQHNIR